MDYTRTNNKKYRNKMLSHSSQHVILAVIISSYFALVEALSNQRCASYPVLANCGNLTHNVALSADICRLQFSEHKCKFCISSSKFQQVLEKFESCKVRGDSPTSKDLTVKKSMTNKKIAKRHVASVIPAMGSCDSLVPPKPGRISCKIFPKTMSCVGFCNEGYLFSDGATKKELNCTDDEGIWRPGKDFLPCESQCNPPCQNGGSCLEVNRCFCTNEFRGSVCEYPLSLCDIEKTDKASNWKCNHTRHDSICEVACHPPRSLEAQTDFYIHMCSSLGEWNPPLPPCVLPKVNNWVTVCTIPDVPENGRLSDHNDTIVYPGDKLSYFCDSGYELDGNHEITCLQNGSWSGDRPTCTFYSKVLSKDPPIVQSTYAPIQTCMDPGDIAYGWKEVSTMVFHAGSVVSYTCYDDYQLVGESDLICLANYTWTAEKPTCVKSASTPQSNQSFCSYTGPPLNTDGRLLLPSDSETSHTLSVQSIIKQGVSESSTQLRMLPVGSRIQYRCRNQFYKLYGSEYQTCQDTGTWSGNKPTCIPECGKSDVPRTPFIVHGNTTLLGQWPWQVAIYVKNIKYKKQQLSCGGTLVAEKWIITAAHCVTMPNTNTVMDIEFVTIYSGKYYRSFEMDDEHVQMRKVRQIVVHENYDFIRFDSDIAVVEMENEVELTSRVQPICLPTDSTTRENIKDDKHGVATGWGLTEEGEYSEVLRESVLPVVSHTRCEENYRQGLRSITVTENMFCAGYEEGQIDTCIGDSGGPMMFPDESQRPQRWILEGIVSWGSGDGCGQAKRFSGFTKVRKFVDWVKMFI